MARILSISLDGFDYSVSLTKVEREKLYGAVKTEAVDENDKPCSLQLLAADGKTFIGVGGTANAVLSEDGDWVERTNLIAINANSEEIQPVASSFSGANVLEEATAEEYLSHLVKSVYLLEPLIDSTSGDEMPTKYLTDRIYKFPFSYRGGLEYDTAFIVTNDDGTFMIVGTRADLEFVKLSQMAVLAAEIDEQELSEDELDFDLL